MGAALGFVLVRPRDFVPCPARAGRAPPRRWSPPRPQLRGRAAPARRQSVRPRRYTEGVLRELRIENLLLIERAELRLGAGLNAITGETGAGKTVLAHSLDLLMGGKARPQIVRPGRRGGLGRGRRSTCPRACSTSPSSPSLPSGCRTAPRRSCSAAGSRPSGRTSAFVAGRSASRRRPAAARARLLAFYGQHEHRKLTLASAQLDVLDGFAGPEHLELRECYARRTASACARRELAELRERDGSRERDLDLLRFELAEIEAPAPDAAELRELARDRERLRHAEGLRDAAAGPTARLPAPTRRAAALRPRWRLAEAPCRASPASTLRSTRSPTALARSRSSSTTSPASCGTTSTLSTPIPPASRPSRSGWSGQTAAQARRQRRGGARARRALPGRDRAAGECRGARRRLEARAEPARGGAARPPSSARGARAPQSRSRRRSRPSSSCAMHGASLEVALEPHPEGLGPAGAERSSCARDQPRHEPPPLRDAASGGELSRVMLALSGLGAGGGRRTLVFDEIDAGIGGNTARAVGERLRALGEGRQVICITHLPQVASLASAHFRIEKDVGGDAPASVQRVEGEGLVAEICRMLGGDAATRLRPATLASSSPPPEPPGTLCRA